MGTILFLIFLASIAWAMFALIKKNWLKKEIEDWYIAYSLWIPVISGVFLLVFYTRSENSFVRFINFDSAFVGAILLFAFFVFFGFVYRCIYYGILKNSLPPLAIPMLVLSIVTGACALYFVDITVEKERIEVCEGIAANPKWWIREQIDNFDHADAREIVRLLDKKILSLHKNFRDINSRDGRAVDSAINALETEKRNILKILVEDK